MSGISLAVADNDELYVNNLCSYFMEVYSDKLNVKAFTDKTVFGSFLKSDICTADALLVNKDMIPEDFTFPDSQVLMLLSDAVINDSGSINVFKYQSADNIASRVFDAISGNSEREIYIKNGSHDTKVISVFSPIGGSGKSTIAVALSKCLSRQGKKAFYLNFEDIPSEAAFFNCNSDYNLSNVFYGIKENNKNLSLKLEAAAFTDISTGVELFAPAESVQEVEDMLPEEIITLIDKIKLSGKYDYVIVDLSCALSSINLEILKVSSHIIFVTMNGTIEDIKTKTMLREFEMLNSRENLGLLDKCTYILNKTSERAEPPKSLNPELSLPYQGTADVRRMTDIIADNLMEFSKTL